MLKEIGSVVFDQPVYTFDNLKVIITDETVSPPPYNGATRKVGNAYELDEVTYENERPLSYYDKRPRLRPSMEYLFRLVPESSYQAFWNEYKDRYLGLKKRYKEAYNIRASF